MARKPMVTRSFKAVDCNVLCMNIETKQSETLSLTLYGNYRSEEKLKEAVRKKVETPVLKVVTVGASDTYEQLLGMSEEKFITEAEKLPPRTNL